MVEAALYQPTARKLSPTALPTLAGRILIAPIFLLSGLAKLADPAGTIGYITSAGLPAPKLAFGIAVLTELVGGLLLLLGYRARLVAGSLAVFTFVAALGFHFDLADQNHFIHFFKNCAIAGGLIQIVARGAGPISVDARR